MLYDKWLETRDTNKVRAPVDEHLHPKRGAPRQNSSLRRMTNVVRTAVCKHRSLRGAVRDIDTTIKNFENLGLGPWRRYILGEADGGHDFLRRDYEGGLDNRAKVALSKWGPIAIELFEPIYFPILEKFLETHGEGIWHFGYSVSRKQFDSTIAELKKKGIDVTGHSEYKNGVRMAFLDPRKTGGIVFQLHDCPPEMEDFFDTMGMVVG
jgi:methylmalonyl-CoA/ethylmalonyl-CoA epimerase